MKYAIIEVTNGNYRVHAEGFTDNVDSAKVSYHDRCKLLWNDAGTTTACVGIIDENFDFIPNYKEVINKSVNGG